MSRHARMALAALTAGALLGAGLPAALAAPAAPAAPARAPAAFQVGAADADITPPALDTPLGQRLDAAAFVPACGASEAQIAQLWPGPRKFAFTDPYVDAAGQGQYVPGDPYCDADGSGRYEAPYLAGGAGANRWPLTSADAATNSAGTRLHNPDATDDPILAHAVVFSAGGRRAAMVTVDSIGLFDTTMDAIRADVTAVDRALAPDAIFVSSTHDESAPDPIGLWGPDLSGEPSPVNQANGQLPAGVSSGVDSYYLSYLAQQVAAAVVRADRSRQPAELKVAVARMPANTQSCWSSYPFVDTPLMPVLQATTPAGRVIFTLADVGTHDETLGFSGNPTYTSMVSGDWTGRLAEVLEADYPGSVGMEMAGLVGSVETPALYPPGTQVLDVPGALHDVPGNPVDACRSVYPQPAGAAPYSDALQFINGYADSVARTAEAALAGAAVVHPRTLHAQTRTVCLQLENNFFLAAFAAGLFPDRPAYADPRCTVGAALDGTVGAGPSGQAASPQAAAPAFLRSEVGVLTVGPVQVAYSPGEVFPFTEIGGPVDGAQLPFPTNCYRPSPAEASNAAAGDYTCGSPLPQTADISAQMSAPYRFFAGLGEDMAGYLFPPGNFVGDTGETGETPWSGYELTTGGGHDRFGYGHSDDSESVGPTAGIEVTRALSALLAADGPGVRVLPGEFVDAAGRACDSPFPATPGQWVTGCAGFTGAVGVRVREPDGSLRTIDTGPGVTWATYLGTPDAGTAGTAYPYSTATRGVLVDGRPLLLDVYAGAAAPGTS